jgi:hypothetical protein
VVNPDESVLGASSEEAIARRAYELYVQRGYQDGYDVDDWLRAEAELARSSATTEEVGNPQSSQTTSSVLP